VAALPVEPGVVSGAAPGSGTITTSSSSGWTVAAPQFLLVPSASNRQEPIGLLSVPAACLRVALAPGLGVRAFVWMAGVTPTRGMEGAGLAASFLSSGCGAGVLPHESVSRINNDAAGVAEREKRSSIFFSSVQRSIVQGLSFARDLFRMTSYELSSPDRFS